MANRWLDRARGLTPEEGTGNNSYVNPWLDKARKYSSRNDVGDLSKSKDYYYMQKNKESIDGLTSNLNSNGIDTPPMLDTGKKWYEQIFDPISSLQYGVARGVKNLVDEDPTTGFFKGIKEGVSSGFDADGSEKQNRTSWKDVLDTLLNNSHEGVRNTTAVVNNIINPFAWKDAIGSMSDERNAVDVAKQHTGLTGFLGDAILDPINLVGGLGAATKVVTKGSEVTKGVGSILDASKALEALGLEAGVKESRALVNKASKVVGKMPDFQGIYVGTKEHNIPIASAEAIKKFADSSIGKAVGGTLNTVVKPVEKVKDYITNSAFGQGVSDRFVGGQYRKVLRDSKANPERAIQNTAFVDFVKRSKNLKGMKADEILNNARNLEKQVGEGNDNVLNALQTKDKQVLEQVGTQEVDRPNPSFQTELEHHWSSLVIQREDIIKQIEDINKKSNGLDLEAVKTVQKLREQLQLIDEMPKVESVSFNKQIRESGLDLSKFDTKRTSYFSDILQNPMGVRNMSIEQLTDYLKELKGKQAINASDDEIESLAVHLKGAADNTIAQIQKDLPELAPYYTGTSVHNGVDVAKHGFNVPENIAETAATNSQAYGLNLSGKDTQDMSIEELQALRDTLGNKATQYTSEGKSKLLEKVNADIEAIYKQMGDVKNSKKAPAPKYSKESPVGLQSKFERINAIKDMPDSIVKKALGRDAIGELTDAELANLEKVKFHYDNLMSKGFYPEAIQKMGVGSIINRSNELLKPDLGRALNLIPTPTKGGMNEETYRQIRKSVEAVFNSGINPYNKKRMINAKDYEDFVNEFVRKNNILGLDEVGYNKKFLDEGKTTDLGNLTHANGEQYTNNSLKQAKEKYNYKVVGKDKEGRPIYDFSQTTKTTENTDMLEMDKFAQQKANEAQKTVYGQTRKLADVNNPGIKRTVEEIQKYVPDFSAESAGRMTSYELTNLMNGLKKGKIDPESLSVKNILENLGSSNSSPVKKIAKDVVNGTDYSNVPKGKKEFLNFETPNGNLHADSTANKNSINAVGNEMLNTPEELKGARQNVEATVMKGNIGENITDKGNLKLEGVTLADGKNIIVKDSKNTKSLTGTLNHETAHAFGNNAWHADRTAASIKKDMLNWNDTQIEEAKKLFEAVGRELGNGKGNITKYLDTLKGADVSKQVMNKETLAELGSVFLHSDPAVKLKANELFPEGSRMMNDLVAKLPKKDLPNLIPKGTTAREEILAKLDAYNTIANQLSKIKPEDLVNKTQLESKLNEIDNLIKNSDAHKEYFKEHYSDVPEFIKVNEPLYEVKDTISSFESLTEEQRKAAEFIRSEFKRFGIEEGIDPKHLQEIYNYFPRVLNFDLRDKPKYQTIFDDLHNPTNQNAKSREFMVGKSIEEVNKYMKEKHGIDNFFESNVVRAYADRALNNNEFMFRKDMLNKSMNLFGKQIDKSAYEGLTPEAKKALYEEVQAMVNSGEYDFVTLDDKLVKKQMNTVDEASLSKAKDNLSHFNPYVQLDPKDIKLEDVMVKNSQPVWLVKKGTHDILKDVAIGQFRQSKDGLLKMIDKFNSLWKTNALFSMGFNFNNSMGNTFNNYLGVGAKALDPKINAAAMLTDFENPKGSFMGKSNKEWRKIAQEFGVLGHDYTSELQDFRTGALDKLSGKSPIKKLASNINPLSQDFAPYKGARFVSGKIESQARLVNFFASIQNGMTIQEAADNVNKFLFDYSDLTDFEHGTMKRLVPFYTWMRKNFPLQVENLFKQPAKYGRIYRGQRDAGKPETEEQRALRPEYLDNAIHVGNGKYINLNLPYNDLNKMVSPKELFSSINPVLKTAVEVGTNKNVYYDTPIAAQEGATVKAPAYMNFLAEDTPNGKRVDAKLRHIFKNLFPSLEQASNAVSVAKGEGSVSNEEKASGWLTGLRTYTVDTKKAKDQAISDYIKKLEELEAKAKSEGYVSKTAKQIKDAKDREEQYQKIKDIYEAEYQKRQAIYQNNYVIKKKK